MKKVAVVWVQPQQRRADGVSQRADYLRIMGCGR